MVLLWTLEVIKVKLTEILKIEINGNIGSDTYTESDMN